MSARALLLSALLGLAGAAAAQTGGAPLPDVGIDQRLGQTLPLDARFLDEEGREVRLAEVVRERPVILALVYYECPMLCTLVLKGLCASLADVRLVPGVDYDVVAVSIDPGETPELARAARDAFARRLGGAHTARGLHFLCGAEPEIARLASAVGFRYAYDASTDQYAHAAGVMVATPEGRLARYFYGIDYSPRDLRLALVEASAGRIGSFVDQVLLLCLHYDPASGRYGLAVQNALRLGGGATVLLLGSFVVRSLLADRRRRARAAHGTAGGEA